MSRSIVIVILAMFVVGSCSKSVKTTVTPPGACIPRDEDSLMPDLQTVMIIGPVMPNVWGTLVACKVSGVLTDTFGSVHLYNRDWEAALFTSATSTSPAGAVSVNSVPMNSSVLEGFYVHYDSTSIWNETSLNHWNVSGTSMVPFISADVPGTFPSFTGPLPVAISHTGDFTFGFNSSNTNSADSAYVVIYGSFDGHVMPVVSDVVSASGGVASISASKLSSIQNTSMHLTWIAEDTTTKYYGGKIMFVIYNHTMQTFGGKQFAFVKQREYLGIVKFL
jgi:hypothetical protein